MMGSIGGPRGLRLPRPARFVKKTTTCLGYGFSYHPKYLVPILTSLPKTVSSSLVLR